MHTYGVVGVILMRNGLWYHLCFAKVIVKRVFLEFVSFAVVRWRLQQPHHNSAWYPAWDLRHAHKRYAFGEPKMKSSVEWNDANIACFYSVLDRLERDVWNGCCCTDATVSTVRLLLDMYSG
jgi:hypothetical protein